MKIIFTETALSDLNEYLTSNYPMLVGPVEQRIDSVLARLQDWPESARKVTQRTNVRVAPLVRYPYRTFFIASRTKRLRLSISATRRADPGKTTTSALTQGLPLRS
jgi:hypothetical protein